MQKFGPIGRRTFMAGTVATAGMLAMPGILRAQSYPSRPITIICGFSAGGTTDALARVLAAQLSETLGQPVIVENRTGAAGAIGMTTVAQSAPDGLTLLFSAVGQLTVVPHISKNLTIDPRTAFEHISLLAEGDFVLTASSALGVSTAEEFIALAKQRPNEILYGTSGAGGNLHLFLEAFLTAADIKLRGVHYAGGSALMPDVLNNQVQIALNSYPVAAPYIAEGQLVPLLIVGKQRNENLPDVPTGPEIGLDLLSNCRDWFGLHAPAGTPSDVVALLAEQVHASLEVPAMAERLTQGSLRPVGSTPEEFSVRIASDYESFGKIAAQAGMTGA